jgi:plasmid maintenance system antidote protein VapI
MRELLEKAGIRQTTLAHWFGVAPRSIRHYLAGDRPVPPFLALWLQYCVEHPEAKDWLARQAKQRKPGAEIEDEGEE